MKHSGSIALLTCLLLLACGCSERTALDAPLPDELAELGVLIRSADRLTPNEGIAYGLGHPLFSDYARKYRTLHLPAGAVAVQVDDDPARTLEFPLGTVITKTFYFPAGGAHGGGAAQVLLGPPTAFAGPDAALDTVGMRLLETRVLRRLATGWEAVSYVWDPTGASARKARTGALFTLGSADGEIFDYLVPDANQCAGCHATNHGSGAIAPIGPKPGNLAAVRMDHDSGHEHQYALWRARGWVAGTATQAWPASGTAAALAYLDANCAHCHSNEGAADTTGLDLRYTADTGGRGLCKSPVAAGRGSGGRAYDVWPGRADASILVYRMNHRDPAVMMPELGRSLIHAEGVAKVSAWINAMEGDCDAGALL